MATYFVVRILNPQYVQIRCRSFSLRPKRNPIAVGSLFRMCFLDKPQKSSRCVGATLAKKINPNRKMQEANHP